MEPTMEKLRLLRLDVLAAAWVEQQKNSEMQKLAFDERLGMLVDAQWLSRENKRLARALKEAKLKLGNACVEDIDCPPRRELDKAVVRQLASCRWVEEHQNVVVTGSTGTGKTYVACALAQQACRKGYRAIYRRATRLTDELTLARADGTYAQLLGRFARADLLVIRRLGPRSREGSGAARPARGDGGPVRHPLDHHDEPAADGEVARPSRRPDDGRRHLRPHPPQRSPNCAKRPHATKGGTPPPTSEPPASLRSDHDRRSA